MLNTQTMTPICCRKARSQTVSSVSTFAVVEFCLSHGIADLEALARRFRAVPTRVASPGDLDDTIGDPAESGSASESFLRYIEQRSLPMPQAAPLAKVLRDLKKYLSDHGLDPDEIAPTSNTAS